MSSSHKHAVWLAPLVALGGLALYLLTLSRGAYPGESAGFVATQLGVAPVAYNSHLVWEALCRLVCALPLGDVATRLNLASVVCAVIALWLLVRLVADAIWMTIEVDDTNRAAATWAARLGGVAAGVYLGISIPFWYVANRFHVAAFDLVLLLALARALLSLVRQPRTWYGLAFACAYGIASVEFPTLVVFGPLVLAALLLGLWVHGELRWGRVLPLAACLVLGLLTYGVEAWRYQASEPFRMAFTDGGYWRALVQVMRMRYALIVHGLPQIGWLLVILVGIVPWLAVLAVGRRALNAEKDWGLYILNFILTGVAVAVLFNVPFAPWALLGPWRLLVTPYLLMAVVYGYLVAYWFLLPRMYFTDDEDPLHQRLKERVGWAPAVLLLAAALVAGGLNFRSADARPAGAINGFARAVVEDLGAKTWLLTDGVFDDNLLVAARIAGKPLRTINLRYGNYGAYMGSLAGAFADARLKSLAQVDLFAFLREWMETDAHFADRVAFMVYPDLWLSGGYQPVPGRTLFVGARPPVDVEPAAAWSAHEALWDRPFVAGLQAARTDRMLGPLCAYALRHLSMVANNLGVLLEDHGAQSQAYSAYARARVLDKDNISARLNQVTMIDRGYAAPDADKQRAELKTLAEGLKAKLQIWSLARTYGYVRIPQAYADMGMVWALSGEPGMAVAGFKRAIELEPGARDQLTYGLASAYMAQDQSNEGEALYRQLLAKNPADARALIGLARLLALRGTYDEATTLLERAGKAGVPKDRLTLEYATLYLAAGDLARARITLQELSELRPEWSTAWAMLAAVLIQQKDMKALEDCQRKLERVKEKDFIVLIVLGQIAMQRADYANARVLFDQVLAMRPANVLVLDQLLRLDIMEGSEEQANVHVRALMVADPNNALANHVLGTLQLKRKEYALAENSLRKSVKRQRTPEALNDLAWVLQERGMLDEAEALTREALKTNEKSAAFWDTLGVVLTKRGNYAEAEQSLKKAIGLFPDELGLQIHLAELYARKGDGRRAAELAEDLLARGSELGAEERDKLRAMVRHMAAK